MKEDVNMAACPREYWNRVAGKKEFPLPVPLELLKAHVALDSQILEVGCGYGRVLALLKENGYTALSGVDFAEEMIACAKERLPDCAFQVNSGSRLPYDDESSDAVVIVAVLTCIVSDDGQRALLAEANRVLRPGGALVLADFLINSDARNLARYETGHARYGTYGVFELDEGVALRHHDAAWIQELAAPFNQVAYEEHVFPTMNRHTSNGFHYLGRKGAGDV